MPLLYQVEHCTKAENYDLAAWLLVNVIDRELFRLGYTQLAAKQLEAVQDKVTDTKLAAGILIDLAQAYDRLGKHKKAQEVCERAKSLSRDTGKPAVHARVLGGLGQSSYNLGRLDDAIDYLQQALTISNQAGDEV